MGPIKGSRFFGLFFKVQSYTKKLERWCCKAIEKEVFWKLVLRNSLENGMVRVTSSSVPPTTSLWELKRLHTVNPIVFTIINANFLKRMRSRCYPSSNQSNPSIFISYLHYNGSHCSFTKWLYHENSIENVCLFVCSNVFFEFSHFRSYTIGTIKREFLLCVNCELCPFLSR